MDLGGGMEMWYGVFQSAVLGWKPFLNIDGKWFDILYAFYSVNSLDTHHSIQRSLLATIFVFLAFNRHSVL